MGMGGDMPGGTPMGGGGSPTGGSNAIQNDTTPKDQEAPGLPEPKGGVI